MAIQTPFLTVDGIIELYDGPALKGIVLIERKNPPHGWALPGGFVDVGERVEDALIREMKEETSLDVTITGLLGRDPRFHTASVVYTCTASGTPKAEDDAKNLKVVPPEALAGLTLAFDHGAILADYRKGR